MTARSEFRRGARAISPLLPSLVPFGIIMGITAVEAGIPGDLAIAMSSVVYAGASQFAAISLLEANTPVAVVVFTMIVINLRFVIYSASLAPHFRSFETRWRLVCGYFVSDHSYAAAIPSLTAEDRTAPRTLWFYLGAGIPPWAVWQASTILGVTLGARVPTTLSLEFTIPLAFIGLLFGTLKERHAGMVAVAAGIVESGAVALPYNLGLIVGTLCGVGVGVVADRHRNTVLAGFRGGD